MVTEIETDEYDFIFCGDKGWIYGKAVIKIRDMNISPNLRITTIVVWHFSKRWVFNLLLSILIISHRF